MKTNKDLAVAQAKEIARLNAEVSALRRALTYSTDQHDAVSRLAAENGHLMAALSELDHPQAQSIPVLMGFYSTTTALVSAVRADGYKQAAEDIKARARGIENPVIYDALMAMANLINEQAQQRINAAIS